MEANEKLDPVVERARAARGALVREHGYDIDRLVQLFRSMEQQHHERVRKPGSHRPDEWTHRSPMN